MSEELIRHYWDGYGNFCNTEDGRRNSSVSTAVLGDVNCPRCRLNLQKIGKISTLKQATDSDSLGRE